MKGYIFKGCSSLSNICIKSDDLDSVGVNIRTFEVVNFNKVNLVIRSNMSYQYRHHRDFGHFKVIIEDDNGMLNDEMPKSIIPQLHQDKDFDTPYDTKIRIFGSYYIIRTYFGIELWCNKNRLGFFSENSAIVETIMTGKIQNIMTYTTEESLSNSLRIIIYTSNGTIEYSQDGNEV